MTLGELQRVLSEEELAAFGIAADGEHRADGLPVEVDADSGEDLTSHLVH
tara:strand:+ start:298 stop:447 length:150 start_codon:yes stop_codon:yes gene_type:complete